MELTALEADLLGDMAQDDHALYEVFHFVRLHHPDAADDEVFRRGRELIRTWLQRGWLAVLPDGSSTPVEATDTLLGIVDAQGVAATYAFEGAPRLVPGHAAYRDVEWLGPAV